jgi:hypothetical protein
MEVEADWQTFSSFSFVIISKVFVHASWSNSLTLFLPEWPSVFEQANLAQLGTLEHIWFVWGQRRTCCHDAMPRASARSVVYQSRANYARC